MSDTLSNIPSSEIDLEKEYVQVYSTRSSGLTLSEILERKKGLRQGRQIGSGGYGLVFMMEKIGDLRPLACKVIDLQETLRKHFTSELNLKRCQHPNLIELVDQFIIDNKAFVVMEYADGGTVADLIANGPLSERTSREYFKQILEGLLYLHHRRVAHRDLKLDNLLLVHSRSIVKLSDFGLSFLAYHHKEGYLKSGNFAGTRPYISPQILRIRVYHQFRADTCFDFNPFAADIYALGVCLFEMLAGFLPFSTARSDEQLLRMQESKEYSFPEQLQVSDDAQNLVAQMLEPDVNYRIDPFGIKYHDWLQN